MAFAMLHELMRSGHLDCPTFARLWQATAEHQAALPRLPRKHQAALPRLPRERKPAPGPASPAPAEKWSLAEKAELQRLVRSRPFHGYPLDTCRDTPLMRKNAAFWKQIAIDLAAICGGSPRTIHAVYRIANRPG
jgi:hypothetical protein